MVSALALCFICLQAQAPRDLTDGFDLPNGLAATLWAESPALYNPAAIDVDERGRVWVAEAVNYRTWEGRNPGLRHPDGDRIVVLEDSDGDGACDRSSVFAQDRDLVAPLGIAVIGGKVYVSCSPSLFVYEDTDGDGKADKRETLLTGFGGRDHDHGLHSVVAGPDGRLWFTAGDAGPTS
jgi:putative membrane-bound dehydrogenase-like protein